MSHSPLATVQGLCGSLTGDDFIFGDLGAELQVLVISARRPAEGIERQYALLCDFRIGVERSMRESAAKADDVLLSKRCLEVEGRLFGASALDGPAHSQTVRPTACGQTRTSGTRRKGALGPRGPRHLARG